MSTIKRTGPTRRGTLLTIGCFLALSASIRFADGTGQAIANEVAQRAQSATIPNQPNGLELLFARLQEKEVELQEREARLETREADLKFAEQGINKILIKVQTAERDLRATMALADEAAENDLLQLTKVYESMKPKDAAALFQTMDPNFAAGFLGRMSSENAAAILAGLPPQQAYQVSLALSGRNLNVPRN